MIVNCVRDAINKNRNRLKTCLVYIKKQLLIRGISNASLFHAYHVNLQLLKLVPRQLCIVKIITYHMPMKCKSIRKTTLDDVWWK